jgi:acyl transferase domain-containing protein
MHQQVYHSTTVRSAHTVFMCFVNSDLFHLQHKLIGFITEMKSVYSAVRAGPLNKAACAPSFKG